MTAEPTSTDRIEKRILLRAPRAKVWRAVTDAKEFGSWFGVAMEGAFTPGATVRGRITSKGYEHVTMEIAIETVEPERLFTFRWHPHAVEPEVDYSSEPSTLVSFELEEVPEGTMLKVVESGFDRVPLARRAKAFAMNDEGWSSQLKAIERYLGAAV